MRRGGVSVVSLSSPLLVGRIFSGSSPSVDMAGDLELKKSLNAVFSRFGKIVEVLAFKTLKHKGQAWVVFDNPEPASNAISKMNGFPFYNKPMRIQFAKRKSDVIAKADGTFVPREKRKRQEEKGEWIKRLEEGSSERGVRSNTACSFDRRVVVRPFVRRY
ncbi:hypothetical protein Bca52824_085057 [Brassica carinata]|uniref:RRM domain-containing protein n=1 Tax=Brassica carinata TaxID=52824 RepID=A0A8X7PN57_BRACI|nr:hypothetical protein Bca52824_085057 [Brassica carinata]